MNNNQHMYKFMYNQPLIVPKLKYYSLVLTKALLITKLAHYSYVVCWKKNTVQKLLMKTAHMKISALTVKWPLTTYALIITESNCEL